MANANAPAELELPTPTETGAPPQAGALAQPAPALPSTGNPIMDMAQQASSRGDVATLEKLLAIRDKEEARSARAAFNAAFTAAQAEFPVIPRRGTGHQNTKYARLEDTLSAVMPVLAKHGLSLRHRTHTNGKITVTAVLAHVDGHSEENSIEAGADTSGSKNAIQGIGSAITYGKRYTTDAILGLASHDTDDDAFAAGDTPKVAEYRELFAGAAHKGEMEAMRADLMRDLEMSGKERTLIGKMWQAVNADLPGAPGGDNE